MEEPKTHADFSPLLLEVAKGFYAQEKQFLQKKIREQRKQLRQLNQQHQKLWTSYRLQFKEVQDWSKRLTELSRYNSRIATELQLAKGWSLGQYHQWASHIK